MAAALAGAGGLPVISTAADEKLIGGSVESLLVFAREQHPDSASSFVSSPTR
ncbi:MAG: hypothetical protein Q7J02_02940 [Rhodocyclaceae bacterium]|nr:hypothetical protein [Rhodocyclaceae bacterium]